MTEKQPYEGFSITDIRRGKDGRSCYIYACLRNPAGEIEISATLNYIVKAIEQRTAHLDTTPDWL